MLPRPGKTTPRRALILVVAAAVVLSATGAAVAPTPAPTDPAPIETSTPTPVAVDPSPLPTPSASTAPTEDPVPGTTVPTTPLPATTPSTPPSPSSPAVPTQLSDTSSYTATPTAPTSFARYFPTNPWIYNGLPGTRYLDPRETDSRGVTRLHLGIDAQGAERQPIFAVAAGTVIGGTWGTSRRDRHGYGNQIEIAHAEGYATRYAHLAEPPLVAEGEHVEAGQLIGYMGGSQRGDLNAVPRHLHFEVTKDGVNVDPLAFLGAATTAPEPGVGTASTPPTGPFLQEIRTRPDGGYVTVSTGLPVSSSVYSAVDMGGDSAQIMASAGGTLHQMAVVAGTWTDVDTHLPLDATSISAVDSGTGFAELFAVEGGRLFHITGDAAGWTKTWTGHFFSGTVSAVRMPDGTVHAMLQQSGYLYYLHPAQGALWDVTDTGLRAGDRVDAVLGETGTPEAMTVIDGEVHRITVVGGVWQSQRTGLPASGSVAAVYAGGGWPIAISAEPHAVGVSRVTNGVWTRYLYGVLATGPFEAVTLRNAGTVLYSVG